YGLTGGVYSRNREHLELARRQFHVGNLYFNRKITGALVGVQPFGGYNMSGTCAKAGSRDYLLLFTQMKVITERF
ncbi:MAG TPA: aldehyde dehydrogenase family protein, partial [Bacillota bacterium]|nr:aldehyde dehydrogenase family protein [Bacillota bacterium]